MKPERSAIWSYSRIANWLVSCVNQYIRLLFAARACWP
jgi:hypothetical protein